MSVRTGSSDFSDPRRGWLAVAVAALLVVAGCGGGATATETSGPTQPAATQQASGGGAATPAATTAPTAAATPAPAKAADSCGLVTKDEVAGYVAGAVQTMAGPSSMDIGFTLGPGCKFTAANGRFIVTTLDPGASLWSQAQPAFPQATAIAGLGDQAIGIDFGGGGGFIAAKKGSVAVYMYAKSGAQGDSGWSTLDALKALMTAALSRV